MMCDSLVSDEVGCLSRCAPLVTPSLQAQTFALRESIRCELEELSCCLPERKNSGWIGESIRYSCWNSAGAKVLGADWKICPSQLTAGGTKVFQCGLVDVS